MEESVTPCANKPLSKSQNQLLQKILAFKCKEISAASKKEEPCSEAAHSLEPETEQVMAAYTDKYIKDTQTLLHKMQTGLADCIDHIATPTIDNTTRIVVSSLLSHFPCVEECGPDENYKMKVFVKKACFLDEDPYSFTKWEERSYVLSGFVCMVGSCILSSQYQFCNKNFVYSEKAVLQLVSDERIIIPSIRAAEAHLNELRELTQKSRVQTIDECCSVLSQAFLLLTTVLNAFGTDKRKAASSRLFRIGAIPREPGAFYVQYTMRDGKLVAVILQLKETSHSGSDSICIEKKWYKLYSRMEIPLCVEFYSFVEKAVQEYLVETSALLHNCRAILSLFP